MGKPQKHKLKTVPITVRNSFLASAWLVSFETLWNIPTFTFFQLSEQYDLHSRFSIQALFKVAICWPWVIKSSEIKFQLHKKKNLFAVSREILTLNILTRENFWWKQYKKKKELWYKIVYLIFTTLLAATILVALATSKMLVSKFVSLDDERQVSVY